MLKIRELDGNGDFRSSECIEYLKEADIVITNPPFSLFREYVAQLMEYNKKFIIIGNQNAINDIDIFPYIKNNELWLGVSMNGSNRWFSAPDNYPVQENAAGFKVVNGKKMFFVNGVAWFTNIENKRRNEELDLYKTYNEKDYPTYDNYNAIEVSKASEIPMDYNGIMGVPITFLYKYNPNQFEIVGKTENRDLYSLKTKVYTSQECKDAYFAKFGKKGTYDLNASGVLIKNGLREKVYSRILIRRK